MNPLSELVSTACHDFAHEVAVETSDRRTTYGELHEAATRVAMQLGSAGARVVAVEGERGAELFSVVVGVVLAGCTLVLVDPALPAARREEMMSIAGADAHAVLRDGRLDIGRRAVAEPSARGDYVFFTSGTTGRPKAISGRWSSVAHFVRWQTATFAIGPGDRVAQLTGISFDVFLRDLFTPLSVGATVCVPPSVVTESLGGVLPWLAASEISVLHAVPFLASHWLGAGEPVATTDLRLTFFAGEPLTEVVVRKWRTRFPAATVVNLYGPTETTLAKFFHVVPDRPAPGLQPVGSALPDTLVKVVDGEIWISTAHGTNGYLNADQTPFVRDDEGVDWYRTGDVGRLDGDTLWVLGRVDLQVKINGNRIEPEGVAAVLSEHPDLDHVAVVPWRRPEGTPFLAAYYSARGAEPAASDLVTWLTARLPAAHVPSVYIGLAELPTTPNGKVDRRALPDPASLLPDDGDLPPRSRQEQEVTAEFRSVLGDEHVAPGSDFFARGGTSVEAVELTVRLQRLTGRQWVMSDIYRLRTPRALAGAIQDRPRVTSSTIPVGATQPDSTGLSPQQRRYHQVYLPRHNRSWSNMVALVPLPDGAERDAVEAALRTVVGRHDSLRASFEQGDGGELVQHFAREAVVDVRVADLSGSAEEQDAQLELLRLADANAVIDLARAPLFRSTLVRHPDGRRTLLWNVHHMVSDGYSQRLFRDEVTSLLGGADERDLPTLPISYRDYIGWAQGHGAAGAEEQAQWWRDVFAEPYERPLLTGRAGTADASGGVAYQLPIPVDLLGAVDRLCRRLGATPFTVCLTALFDVASELYGTDDLVVGTPASGRQQAEVEHVIGNFISLVAIRVRTSDGSGFADRVGLVRDRTAGAMENQGYQYDQVMRMVGAAPDDDRFPLTTVFLSLVEVQDDLPDVPLHRELGCEVKFDLMGYLKRKEDRLWLELQTRRELLSREQLEEVGSRFLAVLERELSLTESVVS